MRVIGLPLRRERGFVGVNKMFDTTGKMGECMSKAFVFLDHVVKVEDVPCRLSLPEGLFSMEGGVVVH